MNAFGRWLRERGLRNVDLARAWKIGEPRALEKVSDGYWPSTREAALKLIMFTGGAVTPDTLLPPVTKGAFRRDPDAKAGREAIRAAQQRAERKNGKTTTKQPGASPD